MAPEWSKLFSEGKSRGILAPQVDFSNGDTSRELNELPTLAKRQKAAEGKKNVAKTSCFHNTTH